MSEVRTITLAGDLDIARREEIAQALTLLPSDTKVLLDFSQATYADSTALSSILTFVVAAKERNVRSAIVIGSKQFERVIQYAGLGEAIQISHSLDEARALMELPQ